MARPEGNIQRSRSDAGLTVRPSLIDSLVDLNPTQPVDIPMSLSQSARFYRESVRRDVEWLLNTRFTAPDPGEELEEVSKSVYAYGLPDFSSYSFSSSVDRGRLLAAIRRTIEVFEPRLTDVEVQLSGAGDKTRQAIRFSISGVLLMDPTPEQVTFDTLLEVSRGQYSVKES